MKPVACLLLAVLVLCALHSEIDAVPAVNGARNCEGTSDRRCPLKLCGPDGPKGWKAQDNSKPYPSCCGGPIC